jgi:hypothetical protein
MGTKSSFATHSPKPSIMRKKIIRRSTKRRTMTTGNRGKKKSKKRKVRRGQFKKLRKKFTKKKIYLKGGGLQERRVALSKFLELTDVGRNEDGQLETKETQELLEIDTKWKGSELEDFVERTRRIENEDEVNQFKRFLKELNYYGPENIHRVWISNPVKEFILQKMNEEMFKELIEILNKRPWKLVKSKSSKK